MKLFTFLILVFISIILPVLVKAQNNVLPIMDSEAMNKNRNLTKDFKEQNNGVILTLEDLISIRNDLLNQGLSVKEIDSQIEEYIINNETTGNPENHTKAAPVNDNCAGATNITIGNPLVCGQTTNQATTQGGETVCVLPGGGMTARTVWYRFTATNDSLVLSLVLTNTTNCVTYLGVFGPFASGTGCLPAAGSNLFCQNMGLVDPGLHKLLTGLTIGSDYLVQIEGLDCGGGFSRDVTFCIGIANPAVNTTVGSASTINGCGTAFNGNTNIGNYPSGTGNGYNNLDNNLGTQVGGAGEVGDDVTFIINNDSWFKFCANTAGTWNITINGIGSCTLPAPPNQGVQAAIFTGTPASLTNIYSFASPMAVGSSYTSTNFAVAAGQCAYIVVDGFAGDACNYNLTLTNVTGGCLLPIELISFTAELFNRNAIIKWSTASEYNNDYFTIEKSHDGINFEFLTKLKGAGNSNQLLNYTETDNNPYKGVSYYRLKQTDFNGRYTYSDIVTVENKINDFKIVPNPSTSESGFVLQDLNNLENVTVVISDITGKIVYNKEYNFVTGNVEIKHNLSSGIYLLKIVGNQNVSSQKLIIK